LMLASMSSGETIAVYTSWQWNGFSRSATSASLPASNLPSSSSSEVASIPESGLSLTSASDTAAISLNSGSASISGVVYYDANGNCIREASDWAIPDAKVALVLESTGETLATLVTDKDGAYSFTGLAADTYTVTLTTPSSVPEEPCVGIVFDANNNFVSKGTDGVAGDSTITSIVLETGYSAVDYDFPQLVFPYQLVSKRLLLNVNPGIDPPPLPVPEPGAYALLAAAGLAMAGFAVLRRRPR